MQIENDYDKEVYNGDVGYIVDVDPEAGKLAATFDGRSVTYGFGELDTLGVKLTVAASLMAAIGDIHRFSHPGKLVSYFGLNPSVRQSGRGPAHYGRISKIGRSHARAMLVEAAWAAAKAPGPLHAFFVRIRAKRGHQIAALAVARKVAVLCWHVLTKEQDYLWARPALVANKMRALQLQAGLPQKKGNQRRPAYAYNVKALRGQELTLAQQA